MSSFLAAVCLVLNVNIGNKEIVGVRTIYEISLYEITIKHFYSTSLYADPVENKQKNKF